MFLNFRIKGRSPGFDFKNIIGESTAIVDEWSDLVVNSDMGKRYDSTMGIGENAIIRLFYAMKVIGCKFVRNDNDLV